MGTPPRIVDVPPRFRVITSSENVPGDERTIVLAPSHAFGDGQHATTRMCLQALAAFAPKANKDGFRLLDVGSGSGILAIGAAKLGGEAVGVEIDPDTIAIAEENARRNGVADRVRFATTWPRDSRGTRSPSHAASHEPSGTFDVVVANILNRILVALAPEIVARLEPSGTLILSGLVSTDVPELIACYAPRLGGRRPEIFEREEWRALVWRSPAR